MDALVVRLRAGLNLLCDKSYGGALGSRLLTRLNRVRWDEIDEAE